MPAEPIAPGGLCVALGYEPVTCGGMSDFFDQIGPGTWPDWVSGIGTSLAFMVAAVAYARDAKSRREAQARLVYSRVSNHMALVPGEVFGDISEGATVGLITAGTARIVPSVSKGDPSSMVALRPCIRLMVTIHNGSAELIGPIKVQVVNLGRGKVFEDFAQQLGSVEPATDEVVSFCFANDDFPGDPALGSTIVFRDAQGAWWRRHGAEPIEAIHDDPQNTDWPKAMKDEWAENARRLGSEPTPDPEVPWRTYFYRLARRFRGKPPIP